MSKSVNRLLTRHDVQKKPAFLLALLLLLVRIESLFQWLIQCQTLFCKVLPSSYWYKLMQLCWENVLGLKLHVGTHTVIIIIQVHVYKVIFKCCCRSVGCIVACYWHSYWGHCPFPDPLHCREKEEEQGKRCELSLGMSLSKFSLLKLFSASTGNQPKLLPISSEHGG